MAGHVTGVGGPVLRRVAWYWKDVDAVAGWRVQDAARGSWRRLRPLATSSPCAP